MQRGRQEDFLPGLNGWIFQALEKTLCCYTAQFIDRLHHGRQRKRTQNCPWHFIVANQREIIGYADLTREHCLHYSQSHQIIGDNECIYWRGEIQQFFCKNACHSLL